MTWLVLEVIGAAYLLACVAGFVMARAAIRDRHFRRIFTILAMLLPFLSVWATIKSLAHRRPLRYNEELAETEDKIERERVALFGGAPLRPSLAETWQRTWLAHLENAALDTARHLNVGRDIVASCAR